VINGSVQLGEHVGIQIVTGSFQQVGFRYDPALLLPKGSPGRGVRSSSRSPKPQRQTRGLPVVYTSGITQLAGDAISFGFIGISEIARSLP
jgi:hypothetical protein